MTTHAVHLQFGHPEVGAAYRQWSGATGHDDPVAVWTTLAHYGLVDVDDLVPDWPADTAAVATLGAQAREHDARIAQVVLAAGAAFADAVIQSRALADNHGRHEPTLGHRISPILTVEIALAMLHPGHHDPAAKPSTAEVTEVTWFDAERAWAQSVVHQPVAQAARRLADRMTESVIGVFDDAATALRHQLSLCPTPGGAPSWPPLIDTILGQVLLDPVVTESVFVKLGQDNTGLGYAHLPRGHWLLYRTTPLPDARRVRGTLTPAAPVAPPPGAAGHLPDQDQE